MWTLLSFHNPNLWDQGFLSETTAVFVWQQHMLSLSGFHLLNWLKLKLLKHVISFALELGVGIVFLLSDCLSLISKLNNPVSDRTSTGAVVYNIKKLASRFVSVSFVHVSRHSYRAAHVLARPSEHASGVM
jgi:hypothetical protein